MGATHGLQIKSAEVNVPTQLGHVVTIVPSNKRMVSPQAAHAGVVTLKYSSVVHSAHPVG